MREIEFKFIIDDKHISASYTLKEILEKSEEDILEDMEVCNCTFTESNNHCECEGEFWDSKITGRLEFTGLKDNNGKGNKVFESDLFEVIFESIVGYKSITVIGQVVFKFGGFQVEFMHPEYKELRYFDLFKLLKNPEKGIIGNIHQDKHLLK